MRDLIIKIVQKVGYEINMSTRAVWAFILLIFGAFSLGILLLVLCIISISSKTATDIRIYFDILYDTSGFIIALIAFTALVAAVMQSREAIKTRKASLILEIETRWNSAGLENSRIEWLRLMNQFYEASEVTQRYTQEEFYRDQIKMLEARIFIHNELVKRRGEKNGTAAKIGGEIVQNSGNYQDIMEIAGFFEYMGFLVSKRYLSLQDVKSLFGQSCVNYYDLLSVHIGKLRENDVKLAQGAHTSAGGASAYQHFAILVENMRPPVPQATVLE